MNKTQVIVKFLGKNLLPALAVCYVSLSALWGEGYLPYPDQISTTLVALALFINSIFRINEAAELKAQLKAGGPIADLGYTKIESGLKFVAEIVLPAVVVFFGTVAGSWGFALTEEVKGTLIAINVLLNSLVQEEEVQVVLKQKEVDAHKYVGPEDDEVEG